MNKIYLDSSVYTKSFQEEEGSDLIREIIKLAETSTDIQIVMSVWTVNETIAAIDKKAYKRREITPEQANKSIGKLLFDISRYSKNTRIQIVPLERDIIKGSSILIHTLHLSADDALHVFTAFAYDCQYIISDDETIKQRADNEIPLYAYSSGLRHMQVLSTTDREQIEKLFKI